MWSPVMLHPLVKITQSIFKQSKLQSWQHICPGEISRQVPAQGADKTYSTFTMALLWLCHWFSFPWEWELICSTSVENNQVVSRLLLSQPQMIVEYQLPPSPGLHPGLAAHAASLPAHIDVHQNLLCSQQLLVATNMFKCFKSTLLNTQGPHDLSQVWFSSRSLQWSQRMLHLPARYYHTPPFLTNTSTSGNHW